MGLLFSIFSKKQSEPTPDTTKSQIKEPSQQEITILKLKTAQDKIYAQKKNLQRNVDKCAEEAKQFIAEKKKERAIFALKRQKLFEQYLQETEQRYFLIQKSINDLETAIMTSSQIELLKQTNELIKQIESANGLEQLQEIAADMKERERKTKEFNQLFDQNHIEDEELDELYNKFEGQIVQEKISLVNKEKVNVSVQQTKDSQITAEKDNKMHIENDKMDIEKDEVEMQLEAALTN